MLWIPAFVGMTEETNGLDKSSPYIYIDRRDACPTVLYSPLGAYAIRLYVLFPSELLFSFFFTRYDSRYFF